MSQFPEAQFLVSAWQARQFPADDGREVAFVGRSNAGKSSALNSITGRRDLARTSKTPGRTQLINFFALKSGGRLVDLPGYGYAKVSKTMRADWGKMAEEYLGERQELALCVQLVDSRHEPSPLDIQLNEWLKFHQKDHIIVATKADKLSNNELQKSLASARKTFAGSRLMAYSAQSGKGRDDLWTAISAAL